MGATCVVEIGRKYIKEDLGSSPPMSGAVEEPVSDFQGVTDSITDFDVRDTSEEQMKSETGLGSDTSALNLFDNERGETINQDPATEASPSASSGHRDCPDQRPDQTRESSLAETGQLRRLSINSPPTDQKPSSKLDEPDCSPTPVIPVDDELQDIISAEMLGATVKPTPSENLIEQIQSASIDATPKPKRKLNSLRKFPLNEPIILVLDSIGTPHPKTCRALKEYIAQEALNKRGMAAEITQKPFYVKETHIPMQDNFTDCGVYLLAYWKKFITSPRKFVTSILSREMDGVADWPDMKVDDIRSEVRNVLLGLAEQQGRVHKEKKRTKKATQNPGQTKKERSMLEQPKLPVESQSRLKPEQLEASSAQELNPLLPQPRPEIRPSSHETQPHIIPHAKGEDKSGNESRSDPESKPQRTARLLSPFEPKPSNSRPSTLVHSSQMERGIEPHGAKSPEHSLRKSSPEVRIYQGHKRPPPPMNTEQSSASTMHEQSDMTNNLDEVVENPSTRYQVKSPKHRRQPSVGRPRRRPSFGPAGKAPSLHPGSSQSPIQIDDSQDTIDVGDRAPVEVGHVHSSSPAKEGHITDELVKQLKDAESQSTIDKKQKGARDGLDDEHDPEIRETPEPIENHKVIEV